MSKECETCDGEGMVFDYMSRFTPPVVRCTDCDGNGEACDDDCDEESFEYCDDDASDIAACRHFEARGY